MVVKIECDKCKKLLQIPEDIYEYAYKITVINWWDGKETKHLCEPCKINLNKLLKTWLKKGE